MHIEVHRTKSTGIKVTNVRNGARGSQYLWLCVPMKGIVCVVAWARLQGDPRDVEAKGTEDEGGHS